VKNATAMTGSECKQSVQLRTYAKLGRTWKWHIEITTKSLTKILAEENMLSFVRQIEGDMNEM